MGCAPCGDGVVLGCTTLVGMDCVSVVGRGREEEDEEDDDDDDEEDGVAG